MALSSGLTLTDLSDYLAPSALCIKPVSFVPDLSSVPPTPTPSTAVSTAPTTPSVEKPQTEIRFDASGDGYEHGGMTGLELGGLGGGQLGAGAATKMKKAEITLNDCLACSGCITSAESVLVSLQSHTEVYSVLSTMSTTHLIPVLSLSPQSLASLSASHRLPPPQVLLSLRRFFRQKLGFRLVFDTTFARELSLLEGRKELDEARATKDSKGKGKTILSSACPGWICYAEKTHGALLPLVSTTMSSQAVQGVLVKRSLIPQYLNVPPEMIYHVSVMPCYDKKLEASRPDFSNEVLGRETDCVLTTGEVEAMLDQEGWDLAAPLDGPSTAPNGEQLELEEEETLFPSLLPLPTSATSSGGYIHNALQSFISTLPSSLYPRLTLSTTSRGTDYDELVLSLSPLSSPSSPPTSPALSPSTNSTTHRTTSQTDQPTLPTPLLRLARCYGFRNLQNVVRRVSKDNAIPISRTTAAAGRRRAVLPPSRRKKDEGDQWEGFDFVEIMACPGGCVNGGGQLSVEGGGREGVKKVEEAFWKVGQTTSSLTDLTRGGERMDVDEWEGVDESVRGFLPRRMDAKVVEVWEALRKERGNEVLRTQYRAVEELEGEINGLAVKW